MSFSESLVFCDSFRTCAAAVSHSLLRKWISPVNNTTKYNVFKKTTTVGKNSYTNT